MSTFGTMIARINREIRRDGLTADVKDQIVDAILHYREERFWFNEGESTAQTTVGEPKYAFPTNFIEIDNVILEDSAGRVYRLEPDHWVDIDDEDTITNSFPTHYAVHGDQLQLRAPPDRILTIKASGHKDLTEVSASASDSATNAWMTVAEPLIRSRAKAGLYQHRIKNVREAASMQAAANSERDKLRRETARKIASGRLKKTTF